MIGVEGPAGFLLEGNNPAPQLQSINPNSSVAAGLSEVLYQGEAEEAFLQGKMVNASSIWSSRQRAFPAWRLGQRLRMETEVYGTVRGAAAGCETICEDFEEED